MILFSCKKFFSSIATRLYIIIDVNSFLLKEHYSQLSADKRIFLCVKLGVPYLGAQDQLSTFFKIL